jgi:hypothetical protein
MTVTASASTASVGQVVRFTIHWSDGAGSQLATIDDYGDGTAFGSSRLVSCRVAPDAGDGPGGGSFTESHAYTRPGRFVARFELTTNGCHAASETRSATVTITVVGPVHTQTPTPTATATAEPTVSGAAG